MPRPHHTALMPVGTIIETPDGITVKKTHPSSKDPFPWTTENGSEYGDEWAAEAIADGAVVTDPNGATR